jgi:5-methylcytosine-specific restriction endonuclease McrA
MNYKRNRNLRYYFRRKGQRIRVILERLDKLHCKVCGTKGGLHLHHRTSIKDGGTNDIDNIEVMCRKHHMEHHGYVGRKV